MNVDNSINSSLSASSDSETTQNSVENGRHCVVKVSTFAKLKEKRQTSIDAPFPFCQFRHCDFTFEREVFLGWGKRLPTSPVKIPNSAKKICLRTNSNNNLYPAPTETVQINERICGVLNLASLFNESFIDVPTKDLITIAYDIDLSCSLESTEQIEMESRHRSSDKEAQWKQLQVGRICGTVFKEGKLNKPMVLTRAARLTLNPIHQCATLNPNIHRNN